MRLFPRWSVNPCGKSCGRLGMGSGRRKGQVRPWPWPVSRGWRKSRSTLTAVLVLTLLLWLFLVSILSLESEVDVSYSLHDNEAVRSIHYQHRDHQEDDVRYSQTSDLIGQSPPGLKSQDDVRKLYYIMFSDVDNYNNNNDINNERRKLFDSDYIAAAAAAISNGNGIVSDYRTIGGRHFEDRMDTRRVIPGRRIQEIRSVRSKGLENRKTGVLRGTRSAFARQRRKGDLIAALHEETNTPDLKKDVDFYDSKNEDYGKWRYPPRRRRDPFSSASISSIPSPSSPSSSSLSAIEAVAATATDANAVENETSRITPRSIPPRARPTNWRKLEPTVRVSSPLARTAALERADMPSSPRNPAASSLPSNQFVFKHLDRVSVDSSSSSRRGSQRQMARIPERGEVKTSRVSRQDNRYREYPKLAHRTTMNDGADNIVSKFKETREPIVETDSSSSYLTALRLSEIRDIDHLHELHGEAILEDDNTKTKHRDNIINNDNNRGVIEGDIMIISSSSSSLSSFSRSPKLLSSHYSSSSDDPVPSMKIAAAENRLSRPFLSPTTNPTMVASRDANTADWEMKRGSDKADGNLSVLQSGRVMDAVTDNDGRKEEEKKKEEKKKEEERKEEKKYYRLPPILFRLNPRDREMANGGSENGTGGKNPGGTGRGADDQTEKLGDKKFDISRDDSLNLRHVINVSGLANHTGMVTGPGEGKEEEEEEEEKNGSRSTTDVTSHDLHWFRSDPLESDGFMKFAYNVTASDIIGSHRSIPDTRPERCPEIPAYNHSKTGQLPKASVVICFHNEAVSVILRTVQSVLDKTPSHLLDRVVLVDDDSSDGIFLGQFPAHVREEFGSVVTLTRTHQREGLVRARLLGASKVTSEVVVFLDAHVECNVGWLEPLLYELRHPGIKVVSPYIDTVKADTFEYRKSPSGLQGGFNWRLEFGWRAAPQEWTQAGDETLPIRTPVISGGLFAVRLDAFLTLGGYDPQLEVWGGENMEISFKTWMCGGSMAILPCSRVGHVFRASLPYGFNDGDRERTVLKNLGRVARVWMDGYADVFQAAVNFPADLAIGDVSKQEELRAGLQCHSFQWYLDHVHPDLDVVSPSTQLYGQMKNRGSLMCMQVSHDDTKKAPVIDLSACKGNKNQTFHLTTEGHLKLGTYCIGPGLDKTLTLSHCRRNFTWIHKNEFLLPTAAKDLCITSVDNELIQLLPCHFKPQDTKSDDGSDPHISRVDSSILKSSDNSLLTGNAIFQQWEFQYSFHWKRKRRR